MPVVQSQNRSPASAVMSDLPSDVMANARIGFLSTVLPHGPAVSQIPLR